jgi:A/G-specific adenine glycosylase
MDTWPDSSPASSPDRLPEYMPEYMPEHMPENKSENMPDFGGDALPNTLGRERIVLSWAWMRQHRRDLPWRHTRDPWAVLVAELMLQQTQVARVLDRWPAFLEQYPNPQAAADAGSAAIVTAWSGLGYNRRALALHRCAVIVSERHKGVLPHTLNELLALPGIGEYTARAVLAFAFATPAAVVDTNVARIIARAYAGVPLSWREVQQRADCLVPEESDAEWVWGWNQGMLDFGATVCTKRSPRCEQCPIQAQCEWQRQRLTQSQGERPDQAQDESQVEVDPATGSAGVGRTQSRFEGSDRQGRGRLIQALREGPVAHDLLSDAMGWPGDTTRSARVVMTLLNDGLVGRNEGTGEFFLA